MAKDNKKTAVCTINGLTRWEINEIETLFLIHHINMDSDSDSDASATPYVGEMPPKLPTNICLQD